MDFDLDLVLNGSLNLYDQYDDYKNGSLESPCEQSQNQSLVLVLGPYVHSIMCVLGLLGNGLLVFTYACSKRPGSITQVLLLHLALADLVLVLVLPLMVVNELWAWPLGVGACKLIRGSYSLSLYAASFLLAAVSADRYAAVVLARCRHSRRAPGLKRAVCVLVWVCAVALSLPSFIFYDHYVPQHSAGLTLNQSWDQDSQPFFSNPSDSGHGGDFVCELRFGDKSTAQLMKVVLPVCQLTVGFLVPLVLMGFCYGRILVRLLRAQSLRRHRAVWLVLVLFLVFVVCHVPYNTALLVNTLVLFQPQECADWDRLVLVLSLTQTLAYLHCVLNPLLYGFNSATFRSHFRRILEECFCKLRTQRRQSSTSQSERTAYTM